MASNPLSGGGTGSVPRAPDQEARSDVPRPSPVSADSSTIPRATASGFTSRVLPHAAFAGFPASRTTDSWSTHQYVSAESDYVPYGYADPLREPDQALSRAALDDVFAENERELSPQEQRAAENDTERCLFTKAWRSLRNDFYDFPEPVSVNFGSDYGDHDEAIVNSYQHIEKLQRLTHKAVGTCWLYDILAQNLIHFNHHGLAMSNSLLFGTELFPRDSAAVIPVTWLAIHDVVLSPNMCLDDFTKEQRDNLGFTRTREHNLGLHPHTRLRDLKKEQREAIGLTRGITISYPHKFIRDLKEYLQVEFGLAGLLGTMQLLRREKFCNGDANIIVQEKDRENVAVVNRITDREIHDLGATWLQRADPLARKSVTTTIDSPVTKKLCHFGIATTDLQYTVRQKLKGFIRLCALALVSYTGSHCTDFRRLVWPSYESNEREAASSIADAAVFQQMPMACLADEIGTPVFILRTGPRVPQALSLHLADYIDMWGPVRVRLSTPGKFGGIAAVHTEKGMFFQQELPAPYALAGEVACHWVPTKLRCTGSGQAMLMLQTHEALPSVPLTFSKDARLLLGHPSVQTETSTTSISFDRPVSAEEISNLHQHYRVNLDCPLSYADLTRCKNFLNRFIDTEDPHAVPEQFAIGLNLGYYASVTGTWTYKQKPATTKKDSILSRCKIGGYSTSWTKILSLQVGLEVSWCTWNARRVTLWRALKLAFSNKPSRALQSQETSHARPEYPMNDCGHRIGDPLCVLNCWTALRLTSSFRRTWASRGVCGAYVQRMTNRDEEVCEEFLSQVMPNCLPLLQSTGVDRNGDLLVYSPFGTCPETVRLPKQFVLWLDMIRDTPQSATFAVLSSECFVYDVSVNCAKRGRVRFRKRCSASSWMNGDVGPQEALLQTRIEVKQRSFQVHGCAFFSWGQDLGVVVNNTLELSSGGSLLFRNRERYGQLARYHPKQPLREQSSKIKDILSRKSDEKPWVHELQDDNGASAYSVSVYIY